MQAMAGPSQKELAEALGVDPSVVTRDKAKGMPVHDVDQARAWRRANVRPRLNATPPAAESRRHAPERAETPGAAESEGAPDYWDSRSRRELAEAELAELKLAEQRGELVRIADIRAQLGKRLAATREALMQIPARISPVVAADNDQASIHDLLRDEIQAVLQQLSQGSA